jgi:hypothetical protein
LKTGMRERVGRDHTSRRSPGARSRCMSWHKAFSRVDSSRRTGTLVAWYVTPTRAHLGELLGVLPRGMSDASPAEGVHTPVHPKVQRPNENLSWGR